MEKDAGTAGRRQPDAFDPKEAQEVAAAAKERLEMLLELMGVQGTADIVAAPDKNFPLELNVAGEDLGILIGRRGQTLGALQYLVQLMQAQQSGTWYPISLDIGGYKKRRYEALRDLAVRLAEKVRTTGRATSLEPMPADERRVVHLTLADDPDVTTESTNEGELRKVVILPRTRDVSARNQ